MWKWYFLALMLTARLAIYCCEEPSPASLPDNLSPLMRSNPVCPPKLPLVDFIHIWEHSPLSPDLSPLKLWATATARSNPRLFSGLAVLGVLEQIAENLILVYIVVRVVRKVAEGLAQSFCWILTIAVCIGLLAYAADSRERLWVVAENLIALLAAKLDK